MHRPQKKRLGNYPIINVIFSITLALFFIGLFGLFVLHTEKLTTCIKENVEMQAYLDKNVSENQSIRIHQLLGKKKFVLKKNGRAQISFASKEDAAQEFITETGENFLPILEENPLRDAYVFNIDPNYQDAAWLQKIKAEIEHMQGVFEVNCLENFIASINNNMAKIGVLLALFSVILAFVVVMLIHNVIKLAMYSQRFLIRSMQLIGATAQFIRKPFMTKALFIGLIGGTIADMLLLSLLYYANLQMPALTKLQMPIQIFMLLALVMVLGVLISLTSTYCVMNKYLRMSLDDLY